MNSRSSNQTPSAVDRDAEEQLLQHISALHARLSVSVEKLVTPLRDQIIAYKEVVAPLSQDLKKNLAVSWPLLEELQKQDNALSSAIQDLKLRIEQYSVELKQVESSSANTVNQLTERSNEILDILRPFSEQFASGQSELTTAATSLRAALSTVEQLNVQGFDEFGTQLDNLHGGQGQISIALRDLTLGQEGLREQLSSLTAQFDEMTSPASSLPSDEIRAQISKLDWTLQSVGQNVAALGNKLASIQEDVASPPMARRTLKSIEDIDHQIGQIARVLNAGTPISETDESIAAPTMEMLQSSITDTRNLLTDIGSQVADAMRYYYQETNRAIAEISSSETSSVGAVDPAFADRTGRFAAIEAAALQKMAWQRNPAAKAPAKSGSYDETRFEDRLKALDPVTFEKWKPVFRAGAASYADNPNENCATWTSAVARGFRDYLSLFAEGPMLDIGCGPVGIPVYLQGYDPGQIMGIEPLEVKQDAGFDVTRGVAEFLPWPAESFATVICATALDHVMDLERALSEMHRVLKKDGRLVLWYADVPGMADYPSTPAADRAAVDNYHLFHIDDVWFQPLLAKWFDVVDMRHIPAGGNVTDVFGVFRPRETVVKDKRPGGRKSKPRPTPERRKPSGTKANPPASDKAKTSAKKTTVKPASAARRKPSGTKAGKPASSKNASSAKTAALKPSAVAPSAPSATKADRPASAKSETPAEKTVAKPSVPARKKPARTRAVKSASKPGENGKKPSGAAQSGSAKTTEKSTKT
ncbi:methyltransferase domain-containing protein [Hyphobacterium indicum]|uniref:methyltransferase domain-containing protein n=1 Tax=Hyphobacterium indicum TaxID=2162714 RepID=UPI000F63C337|nr:methyltransferase domain-containing protein [Hyphobacterium indicum]